MRNTSERKKCSHACTFCRVKKAKCSGKQPCGTCTERGEECVFPEVVPRRKRKSKDALDLDKRFARLEAALFAGLSHRSGVNLDSSGSGSGPTDASPLSNIHISNPSCQSPSSSSSLSMSSPLFPLSLSPPQSSSQAHTTNNIINVMHDNMAPLGQSTTQVQAIESPLSPTRVSNLLQPVEVMGAPNKMPRLCSAVDDEPVHPRAETYLPPSPPSTTVVDATSSAYDNASPEFQEPNTYLPICSESGIDWVSRELGAGSFISTARKLTADVLRNERLQQKLRPERAPEPDRATAMEWVAAFFAHSLDSVYGVIHRPAFEARLQQHFARRVVDGPEDPAWYALRNAVYASGCRHVLSEDASPDCFTKARTQAWKYFENALSVHTELIYARSDVTAVQALLFMAFFAEALGSPAIEFMLLSNATRLAQSNGMHLQAASRNIKQEDALVRQWLWWCIYSYDKHLAYRSGRPSSIDDDDISCPIPEQIPAGGTINLTFFKSTVQHAQISSKIAKRLGTVKAMQQTPEQTLETVLELEHELKTWHDALPLHLRSKPPFRLDGLPPGIQLFHVIFLHFSYYGSLISIHAAFCYPWNRPACARSQNPSIAAQRQRSAEILADASRNVIMATHRLQISAATPVWLTFYFPLIGLINLFVYVLKHPHAPTAQSDISLMDVVVGHFGYLEYISASELRFPFPHDIVACARNMVKRVSETSTGSTTGLDATAQGLGLERDRVNSNMFVIPDLWPSDIDDFQIDDWPNLLPCMSGVSASTRFNGALQDPDMDLGQL